MWILSKLYTVNATQKNMERIESLTINRDYVILSRYSLIQPK